MNFQLSVFAIAGYFLTCLAGAEAVGNGTGFYIDRKTILTCAHCVPEKSNIIVARSDSKLLVGKLVFVDRKLDIALISTEEQNEFWLSFGNSESLKLLDDPEPSNRLANHETGEFRPKTFVPKLNPFYVALPYNYVSSGRYKPEVAKVIPWFAQSNTVAGKSVCKDRWLQIYNGSRSCYAQWEDSGPHGTDDWEFVFGNKPSKTSSSEFAGIAISPSVRDYLGLRSGQKVHWRFVERGQIPYGPWKKYGPESKNPDSLTQQKYLDYLKRTVRGAQRRRLRAGRG